MTRLILIVLCISLSVRSKGSTSTTNSQVALISQSTTVQGKAGIQPDNVDRACILSICSVDCFALWSYQVLPLPYMVIPIPSPAAPFPQALSGSTARHLCHFLTLLNPLSGSLLVINWKTVPGFPPFCPFLPASLIAKVCQGYCFMFCSPIGTLSEWQLRWHEIHLLYTTLIFPGPAPGTGPRPKPKTQNAECLLK